MLGQETEDGLRNELSRLTRESYQLWMKITNLEDQYAILQQQIGAVKQRMKDARRDTVNQP